MATAQLGAVLRHIRDLAADQTMSEQSDGALLRAFLGRNDQVAFEALMRRHGPMVLRVCRRALGDTHDAGLSETLRAPFILCCLENKGCAEAAQQLGLEEGTVRMRLTRARRRLQERLTRRGVSLAAVLAAVAVGANGAWAAVPRSLLGPTVKAAAQVAAGRALTGGSVSAQVITLVEGVNQAMFLNKCKTAILLLLCTALVGTGLGRAALRCVGAEPATLAQLAPQEGARDGLKKESPQPAATPAKGEAKDVVQVRGRVLDPDGKPVAGVKLYLGGHTSLKTPTYPERATSGDDGNFAFTFVKSDLNKMDADDAAYQILAVAEGYGCAWVTASTTGTADALALRLVKESPVSGRILDADGKPVAGAKLTVTGVCAAKGGDGRGFVDLIEGGHFSYAFAGGWVGPLPGQPGVLTTAADGKFRLAEIGSDRVVSFRLEGPGIVTEALGAHGTSFEYQAAVSRPIRGVVRDKDTGKPLAGVTVFWSTGTNRRYIEDRWRKAITDQEGRYELLGLAKSPRYTLAVRPANGQFYFQRTVELTDTAGLDPLTADIELVQGMTVRGKVTDKATGKPVAQALVEYVVFS